MYDLVHRKNSERKSLKYNLFLFISEQWIFVKVVAGVVRVLEPIFPVRTVGKQNTARKGVVLKTKKDTVHSVRCGVPRSAAIQGV